MDKLKISPVEDNDIFLIETWMNKDYIIKWYENPAEWIKEIRGRFDKFSFIKHFLVTYADKPIGFCQYYDCREAGEDWYGEIPLAGTFSIDYLIGEKEYLRRGFGKAIIGLLMQEVFSLKDAKRIIVSPDKENVASCKSLLANSFIFDEKNRLYYKGEE